MRQAGVVLDVETERDMGTVSSRDIKEWESIEKWNSDELEISRSRDILVCLSGFANNLTVIEKLQEEHNLFRRHHIIVLAPPRTNFKLFDLSRRRPGVELQTRSTSSINSQSLESEAH
jgi:hypothetical protein